MADVARTRGAPRGAHHQAVTTPQRATGAVPRSGDVVHLGRDASVQFSGANAIRMRVIRVHEWSTYPGWVWLDGYVLDVDGDAVERRSVFVRLAGLRDPRRNPPPRTSMTSPHS